MFGEFGQNLLLEYNNKAMTIYAGSTMMGVDMLNVLNLL